MALVVFQEKEKVNIYLFAGRMVNGAFTGKGRKLNIYLFRGTMAQRAWFFIKNRKVNIYLFNGAALLVFFKE